MSLESFHLVDCIFVKDINKYLCKKCWQANVCLVPILELLNWHCKQQKSRTKTVNLQVGLELVLKYYMAKKLLWLDWVHTLNTFAAPKFTNEWFMYLGKSQ